MPDSETWGTGDRPGAHPFTRVPVEITVSVGRAYPVVRELLTLEKEAVLVLDKRVEDPVDLYIGDKLVARGELQELDGENAGRLAVRLTEVAELPSGL